jgi:hypothetical protein
VPQALLERLDFRLNLFAPGVEHGGVRRKVLLEDEFGALELRFEADDGVLAGPRSP